MEERMTKKEHPRLYKCPDCGAVHRSTYALKQHRQTCVERPAPVREEPAPMANPFKAGYGSEGDKYHSFTERRVLPPYYSREE